MVHLCGNIADGNGVHGSIARSNTRQVIQRGGRISCDHDLRLPSSKFDGHETMLLDIGKNYDDPGDRDTLSSRRVILFPCPYELAFRLNREEGINPLGCAEGQYAEVIFMLHPKFKQLSYIGIKVRPSLREALERAAADRKVTMTHVVITALASHLRRAGYFHPSRNSRTAKRNERLRLAHIINAKKAKRRRGSMNIKGRAIGGGRALE